jgi:hypothetical protein
VLSQLLWSKNLPSSKLRESWHSKTIANYQQPLCHLWHYQLVHATSQSSQDWVPVSTRLEAKKQLLSSKVFSQQSQTLNSLKSARATAANVLRKLTHRSQTNKRTEPSQSADQSKFLRTSTCKKTVRLLSNLTEEPKRIPSARETMLREVLEADLAAPLLARAQQSSANQADHQIYL